MSDRSINTIVLRGNGHHDEGITDTAIYPGEAARLAADGHYDPETLTQANAIGKGLCIVQENALVGGTTSTQYAAGDTIPLYFPQRGDLINCRVKSGENISIGDHLAAEGSGSGVFVEVSSSSSTPYPQRLTSMKVHDAMATDLPATAANDDMALVTGTPGTDAPRLQGVDFGGGSTDEKAAFEFVLPPEYRAGATITCRLNAQMNTSVSDGTATVDVEAWKANGSGGVGSDLCATAAQSINSTTAANKDFTITPTGLVAGDKLIVRLSFGGSDSGNAAVMIPQINAVTMLVGAGVAAQVEAIESSGGALAAAGLINCRVL